MTFKEKIFFLLKSQTSKNIIINTLGIYLNVFFTAFFAFLLVRVMNPIEYGTLSVVLGIIYVLTNILDFGTTANIFSNLPVISEKKSLEKFIFLKTIFFFQSLLSIIFLIIFLILFPYLDKLFFKTYISKTELYLVIFSILFFIWQNFIINSLNATKKFFISNLHLNISNFIKTFFIFILIFLNKVNVFSIIFTFGILGPIVFFLLLFIEKKPQILKVLKSPIKKEKFRFNYAFTFFIASQFFNLGQRIDLFLLSYFLPKSPEIGYYGLAQKIILTIIAAITAITQVLTPNFSKVKTKNEIKKLIKQSFLYLSLPVFLFLILTILPKWLFNLFFTKKYFLTVDVIHLMALSYIIYPYLHIPFLFLLYTVKKPKKILLNNIIYFLLMTIGCYLTIPKFNIYGPLITIFFSFSIIFINATFMALKEYKNIK